MASRSHPRAGRHRAVVGEQTHIVLKHIQMYPIEAVSTLLALSSACNLHCKIVSE